MRVAIVGGGIAGLTAAYLLDPLHEIVLFEADRRLGGHTHTVEAPTPRGPLAIDTGFIVCNERNYPLFLRLLAKLEIATQPSEMSFSVRCEETGLEYAGRTFDSLFAQRRNLLRPGFFRLLRDLARFFRESRPLLAAGAAHGLTLGEHLARQRYSREFVDQHLIPMGAAVWSTDPPRLLDYPAEAFLRFLDQHGMLQWTGRPQWRVVTGGSRRYVDALRSRLRGSIRLGEPVRSIRRRADGVDLATDSVEPERFDQVIVATHSDQALALLEDPSDDEVRLLGAVPYQANDVVLHTDRRMLPRNRRAWASWNYHLLGRVPPRLAVTYHMNRLQGIRAQEDYCITLNRTQDIDPARILGEYVYHHPVFTAAGIETQRSHARLIGVNRTSFCGAYWGYGFHEDGVRSALAVCEPLGGVL